MKRLAIVLLLLGFVLGRFSKQTHWVQPIPPFFVPIEASVIPSFVKSNNFYHVQILSGNTSVIGSITPVADVGFCELKFLGAFSSQTTYSGTDGAILSFTSTTSVTAAHNQSATTTLDVEFQVLEYYSIFVKTKAQRGTVSLPTNTMLASVTLGTALSALTKAVLTPLGSYSDNGGSTPSGNALDYPEVPEYGLSTTAVFVERGSASGGPNITAAYQVIEFR